MNLAGWLTHIERLHPQEIELGLARVKAVADRLHLKPLHSRVITVAGTNGKGSFVRLLEECLRCHGKTVASYTSPHLDRFNERIRIEGRPVTDEELVKAFSAVEQARSPEELTYFEFGTLAAHLAVSEKLTATMCYSR